MDGPPPLAQQQNTDGDADHQPRRKADAVSSATDRARRRALRRLHHVVAHTTTCPRHRSDATTLPAGVATESDDRADRLTAGSAGAGAFSVPTIDLRRLRGTDAEREALATELRACCHDGAGFFYLVGHGVEPRLFDEVLSTARRAFELPDDVKLRLDKRRSPHFRGFEPTGVELTGGRPDTREQFDTWSDCEPVPNAAGNDRLLGPSQYFDDATLPGYERITKEWMTRLSAVSVELLEVLSLALELPPSALHDRETLARPITARSPACAAAHCHGLSRSPPLTSSLAPLTRRFILLIEIQCLTAAGFGPEPERQSLIKYIHYPKTPTDGQGVGLHQDSQFLTILLPGAENTFVAHHSYTKNDHFTKTGSGQT